MGESGLAGATIRRVATPIREQVVTALRKAILDLEFKPGERLVEGRLVEIFGVSRPTIREALGELKAEGLVTTIPQQGAVVTELDPRDAADLYEIRIRMECLIIERFVQNATDEQIDRFAALVERLAELSEQDLPLSAWLQAKDDIFAVLLEGAGSPMLQQMVEGIQARIRVLRARSMSAPGRLVETTTELREIAEVARRRDVALAASLYDAHLRRAASLALATFPEPTSSR